MELWKLKEYGSICQILIFLLVAVTGGATLMIGLMMNTKYGPQAQQPLFIRLNSFSISNLNFSDPSILSQARWEANLSFGNHHKSFEIAIDGFRSFVHYADNEDGQDDHALSCAFVRGVRLGPREEKVVAIRFRIGSGCERGDKFRVDENVVREIREGIGENGSVHFGIVMDFPRVSYRKGPWSWVYELKPRCSDLDVMFVRDKGVGFLSVDRPRLCLIPSVK